VGGRYALDTPLPYIYNHDHWYRWQQDGVIVTHHCSLQALSSNNCKAGDLPAKKSSEVGSGLENVSIKSDTNTQIFQENRTKGYNWFNTNICSMKK
jgi:hypothetical protein